MTEIAFLVGFENVSAFARAFRRWSGVSPSTYRALEVRRQADGARDVGGAHRGLDRN